jgi:hypothetical protein
MDIIKMKQHFCLYIIITGMNCLLINTVACSGIKLFLDVIQQQTNNNDDKQNIKKHVLKQAVEPV